MLFLTSLNLLSTSAKERKGSAGEFGRARHSSREEVRGSPKLIEYICWNHGYLSQKSWQSHQRSLLSAPSGSQMHKERARFPGLFAFTSLTRGRGAIALNSWFAFAEAFCFCLCCYFSSACFPHTGLAHKESVNVSICAISGLLKRSVICLLGFRDSYTRNSSCNLKSLLFRP